MSKYVKKIYYGHKGRIFFVYAKTYPPSLTEVETYEYLGKYIKSISKFPIFYSSSSSRDYQIHLERVAYTMTREDMDYYV